MGERAWGAVGEGAVQGAHELVEVVDVENRGVAAEDGIGGGEELPDGHPVRGREIVRGHGREVAECEVAELEPELLEQSGVGEVDIELEG